MWRETGVGAALGPGPREKAPPGLTLSASAGGAQPAPRPPPKAQPPPLPSSHPILSGPLGPAFGAVAMSLYIGAIFAVAGSIAVACVLSVFIHPAFLSVPAAFLVLALIPLREPGSLASAFTRFAMAAAGRYFDFTVVYESGAGPPAGGRPYVLAYAPHSALPVGLPIAFCELSPFCAPAWGRVRTLASSTVSEEKERGRREGRKEKRRGRWARRRGEKREKGWRTVSVERWPENSETASRAVGTGRAAIHPSAAGALSPGLPPRREEGERRSAVSLGLRAG